MPTITICRCGHRVLTRGWQSAYNAASNPVASMPVAYQWM